jgi:hypothetical protein
MPEAVSLPRTGADVDESEVAMPVNVPLNSILTDVDESEVAMPVNVPPNSILADADESEVTMPVNVTFNSTVSDVDKSEDHEVAKRVNSIESMVPDELSKLQSPHLTEPATFMEILSKRPDMHLSQRVKTHGHPKGSSQSATGLQRMGEKKVWKKYELWWMTNRKQPNWNMSVI